MNTLAIDTSSDTIYLCLALGDASSPTKRFETQVVSNGARHSESLVPLMLSLCERNSLTFKDLDLLVCTQGPGSFTGLRIGMSALKGIALASDTPLCSLSTLDALAACAAPFPGIVLPVIDARKQRFYTALYEDGSRKTPDLDISIAEIEELIQPYDTVLLTGFDAQTVATKLSTYTGNIIVDEKLTQSLPLVLIEMGWQKFAQDGADDIGTGPTYVRKSDAELTLLEKIRSMEEQHD